MRQMVFDTPGGFTVAIALRDDNSLVEKFYFQGKHVLVDYEDGAGYRLSGDDAKLVATKRLELYANN